MLNIIASRTKFNIHIHIKHVTTLHNENPILLNFLCSVGMGKVVSPTSNILMLNYFMFNQWNIKAKEHKK